MRKYIILFFLVWPFLQGCKNAPDDIIPKDKMAALLTEVHLVDATMMNIPQQPDSLYKYGTARYLLVFKRFNVDSSQFRKNYKYYTTKPEELQIIYDQVTKNLQKMNDSVTVLLAKQNTQTYGKKPFQQGAPGKMVPGANKPANGAPPAGGENTPNGVVFGKGLSPATIKAMRDSARVRRIRREHAVSKK